MFKTHTKFFSESNSNPTDNIGSLVKHFIRLEVKLQPNIGFTLRRVLVVFTRQL